MTTKIHSSNRVALVVLVVFLASITLARAATAASLSFPIPELGGCTDRESCKTYCDDRANRDACTAFASAHGLIKVSLSQSHSSASSTAPKNDPIAVALAEDGGPGQCAAGAAHPQEACKEYCSDTAHLETCVAYGTAHDLYRSQERQDNATSVANALKGGTELPGNCTTKDGCQAYCQAHAAECLQFAQEHDIRPRLLEGGPAQQGGIASSSNTTAKLRDIIDRTKGLRECLINAVGADELTSVATGTQPASAIAQALSTCMQQLGPLQMPNGAGSSTPSAVVRPVPMNGPNGSTTDAAGIKERLNNALQQLKNSVNVTVNPGQGSGAAGNSNWMPPPLNSSAQQLHATVPPSGAPSHQPMPMPPPGTMPQPLPMQMPPDEAPTVSSPTSFTGYLSQMAAVTIGMLSGHF